MSFAIALSLIDGCEAVAVVCGGVQEFVLLHLIAPRDINANSIEADLRSIIYGEPHDIAVTNCGDMLSLDVALAQFADMTAHRVKLVCDAHRT